jgi:hypothetical protein
VDAPEEVRAYVLLGLLGLGLLRRGAIATTAVSLFAILFAVTGAEFGLGPSGQLLALFVAGSSLYLVRKAIVLKLDLAAALLAIWLAAFTTPFATPAGMIALPYLIACVAYCTPRGLRRLVAKGDVSYGVYLYASRSRRHSSRRSGRSSAAARRDRGAGSVAGGPRLVEVRRATDAPMATSSVTCTTKARVASRRRGCSLARIAQWPGGGRCHGLGSVIERLRCQRMATAPDRIRDAVDVKPVVERPAGREHTLSPDHATRMDGRDHCRRRVRQRPRDEEPEDRHRGQREDHTQSPPCRTSSHSLMVALPNQDAKGGASR